MEKNRNKLFSILISVLLVVVFAFSLTACSTEKQTTDNTVAVDNNGTYMTDNVVYAMPKAMYFSANTLAKALAANETGVSVMIEASVWPENASNKKVDYSVAWGVAPTYGSQSVTDFVNVSQASDGSTQATVTCYKSFGTDTIILTVTTRDGGYTDKCTISFAGLASAMSITNADLSLSNSTERGYYYELGTGKTYTFDVGLSNTFNEVRTYNLTATLDAVGQVYFGTTFCDASSGFSYFQSGEKKNISEFMNEFISVSISGTTLTVRTDSTYIENFYSSSEPDEYYTGTYTYDRFVYLDEYGLTGGSNGFDYASISQENQTLLKSCYFTITIKDSASGLSETIKVWATPSVNGVSLSSDTLEF